MSWKRSSRHSDARDHAANEKQGLVQHWHCLLKVEDVDAVAFAKDEGRHQRVPAARGVSEVDASFQ